MRKILFMIMMAVGMTAMAQDGKWVSQTIEGDELKGTSTTVAHCYIQEDMGMFIFWEGSNRFAIVSTQMFSTTVSNGDTGTLAFIGIYDNNGNLKEKIKLWLTLDTNSKFKKLFAIETFNNPIIKGHKKNIKKVLDALKSGDGYIRILTSRYQTSDFDLKVPYYHE